MCRVGFRGASGAIAQRSPPDGGLYQALELITKKKEAKHFH